MLDLGLIAFAQPWILAAMAALPVLWWLLRVTPPSPRSVAFPAIRLLFGLTPPEETPARTPWWLLLLRLAVAALIILGVAQPLLNPAARLSGSGPLVLVLDDGWAAAHRWQSRVLAWEGLLDQAEREGRPVMLLTTAPDELDQTARASGLLSAAEARKKLRGVTPKPWPADRSAALAALEDVTLAERPHIVWLSNGLQGPSFDELATRLRNLGDVTLLHDEVGAEPHLVLPPVSSGAALTLRARRARAEGSETVALLATADDGSLVARSEVTIAEGETLGEVPLELPAEMRNRIARVSIEGESQAGGVLLLDERWRRRPVGLVATGPLESAQPLLSELYYLERALEPFTELRRGSIEELLRRDLAVLVLPDVGDLPQAETERLTAWVERGGLLLRFAGPRLAEGEGDGMLPVVLRGGGRTLGGVLTWDSPARLADFDHASPFDGLEVPKDVLINRQVLAEPSLDLGDRTWARLIDGTPLVTADGLGKGHVVLIHTSANTQWSNLAISGLFVEMLRRVVAASQGVESESGETEALPPLATLNGFGRLGQPPPTALAIGREALDAGAIDPSHPPGYYGRDSRRRAHNLIDSDPPLQPIDDLPSGAVGATYSDAGETDLKPFLLAAALVLALVDLLVSLALRGVFAGAARAGAAVFMLAMLLPAEPVQAQGAAGSESFATDSFAMEATLQTRLAYVKTGVPAIDDTSRAGLTGLSRVLVQRTSIEAGTPLGVDLDTDELAFFPLIYWPIAPEQRSLTERARRKVNHFLAHGGTVLFDLREASAGIHLLGGTSRGSDALRRLTANLDIPPLAPVPPDHVVTKSFYLMQDFPGRYAGGALWIGATEGRVNDGVASILIGSNDWASAWAINELGRPLFAVVPGGERQRELSYRFGVNLVMYALTGNYKADQVHVPFILERLGQ